MAVGIEGRKWEETGKIKDLRYNYPYGLIWNIYIIICFPAITRCLKCKINQSKSFSYVSKTIKFQLFKIEDHLPFHSVFRSSFFYQRVNDQLLLFIAKIIFWWVWGLQSELYPHTYIYIPRGQCDKKGQNRQVVQTFKNLIQQVKASSPGEPKSGRFSKY